MRQHDRGADFVSRDAGEEFPAAAENTATVQSNEWVSRQYKLLVLNAAAPATHAAPGQFFNIECPPAGEDRPFFRRPMSTYLADAASGRLEFLYKVTGAGTRTLATLAPGASLRLLGPLGKGFRLDRAWNKIVVLGRGVGLATLAPLAEAAAAQGIRVLAIVSARDAETVLSADRFARGGAEVEIVLDTDGSSAPAALEERLRRLQADAPADAYFTCGSNRLLLLMQRLAREFGIPGQVAMEQQMACGLGMCFCCVRTFQVDGATTTRRVCWDGPVFDLAEPVSW